MKILIALAAVGLMATGASAQMTTQRTTTVVKTHRVVPMAHRTHRVCHTRWSHHKKIRTCRVTRY